ncbi:hypothetical protein ATO6_13290 [Oceanicola sp. 22II-s10i]|uniref:DUF4114 domain-containing protein n=1 Tax=Oceanicola sp. 22II-s10i TaxID=1317116 RepID=UPI000B51F6E4|nr:DUF4114 domain-containing protein [Oceanicola sp. 22II-s10i]OWU84625.1 hypothetical protein ATO6_13290 [Oceanicola sp. 22II-s10i]
MPVPIILLAGQSNAGRVSDEIDAALAARYGGGEYVLVDVHASGAPLTRPRDGKDDWFTPSELPDDLTEAAVTALRDTPDGKIAGMIWVQGEGDTHGAGVPDDYAARVRALWSGLSEAVGTAIGPGTGIDEAPFIVSRLSAAAPQADSRVNWAAIMAAQQDLGTAPGFLTVDPDAIAARDGMGTAQMFSDPLHYSDDFSDSLAQELVAALPYVGGTDVGGHDAETAVRDLTGGPGRDVLQATDAAEVMTGGGGPDRYVGTAANLAGDAITDFSSLDRIEVRDALLSSTDLSIGPEQARLAMDTDGDGAADGLLKIRGDFRDDRFLTVHEGGDTTIVLGAATPALAEGRAVDPAQFDPRTVQPMLTGDGETDFRVELINVGFAGFDNAVGVYEVTPQGRIVDVRILFDSAKSGPASATVTGVEDGNGVGFFVLQDGAGWVQDNDGAEFRFTNRSGGPATLADGDGMRLMADQEVAEIEVFHSLAAAQNSDGLQHVIAGINDDGVSITLGFEDLFGGGDSDFEDVVLWITPDEDILL